jgi:hypothetical protein
MKKVRNKEGLKIKEMEISKYLYSLIAGIIFSYKSHDTKTNSYKKKINRGNGTNPQKCFTTFSHSLILGCYEGKGNINYSPMFILGTWGDSYLYNIEEGFVGAVRNKISIGFYNYKKFSLVINPIKFTYLNVDELNLCFDLFISKKDIKTTLYLILLEPNGEIRSGLSKDKGSCPLVQGFSLSRDLDKKGIPLVCFKTKSVSPPFAKTEAYSFFMTAVKPGAADFSSDLIFTRITTQYSLRATMPMDWSPFKLINFYGE